MTDISDMAKQLGRQSSQRSGLNDGLVEAIRRKDPSKSYIAATQWHPEFHAPGADTIDDTAMLDDFLDAVLAAKSAPSSAPKQQTLTT